MGIFGTTTQHRGLCVRGVRLSPRYDASVHHGIENDAGPRLSANKVTVWRKLRRRPDEARQHRGLAE